MADEVDEVNSIKHAIHKILRLIDASDTHELSKYVGLVAQTLTN